MGGQQIINGVVEGRTEWTYGVVQTQLHGAVHPQQ